MPDGDIGTGSESDEQRESSADADVDRVKLNEIGNTDGDSIAPVDDGRSEKFHDGLKRTKTGKIDGRQFRGKNRGTSGVYDFPAPAGDGEPSGKEKKSVRLNKMDISDVLYSMHLMIAAGLKVPELEIDKDEAKKLGDAINEVAKHYTVEFDPKHVAVFNLCMVVGGIYGPRALAIIHTRKSGPVKVTAMPPASQHTGNHPIDLKFGTVEMYT